MPAEMVQIAAASEPWCLSHDVLEAIRVIHAVVGAETYSSSPIFPVKETKKKKPKASLADVTTNLNKLSEETFDTVAPLIYASLENTDAATREAAAAYLVRIASTSNFGTEWYAKIFDRSAKVWPVFYEKFTDRQDEYKEALKVGQENQRNFLNFAIHLSKIGAIAPMNVLAEKIHTMIEATALNADRKGAVEEWAEHLALLVQHGVPISAARLKEVCKMRPSTHPGISNKTLFKYMDMVDASK